MAVCTDTTELTGLSCFNPQITPSLNAEVPDYGYL